MNRHIITSSPWGFRFYKLNDYAKTLKETGIRDLCLMIGDGFPLCVSGGTNGGKTAGKILADSGCRAIEAAIRKEMPEDLKLAAATGAKYARICEIWEHDEETFQAITALVRSVGEKAADLGLTVIVENHGGLLATSDDCVRFFETVGLPNVKLNYDAANFIHYGGEDAVSALRKTAEFTGFAHLKSVTSLKFKQGGFCRICDGAMDYGALMRELLTRFSGPLCLEYENPDDAGQGTADDMRALTRIISEIEKQRS